MTELGMWHQSEQIHDLAAAIVAAQLKMVPAAKDHVNPYFNSKYADLASVWEALVCFREAGIAITQSPMEAPAGHLALETQLTHVTGQWMRSRLVVPLVKQDPQSAGSALTYARRYALGCMTGLVTEADDDGNRAGQAPERPQSAQEPRAPAPPNPSVDFGDVTVGKDQTPIKELDLKGMHWWKGHYEQKLADPKNATSRYRAEWEEKVLSLEQAIAYMHEMNTEETA